MLNSDIWWSTSRPLAPAGGLEAGGHSVLVCWRLAAVSCADLSAVLYKHLLLLLVKNLI